MYVHLGTGHSLKSLDIIGIFSVGDTPSYEDLRRRNGRPYDIVDCTGGSVVSTYILTNDKIYLSAISAATLQKRAEQYTQNMKQLMNQWDGGNDE
ncbi:MAG: DUF370 domain-containing protein [Succiniclasticum sp.]|jgi:predicted ATP-grasp superfamily ATP-dependent carboligase